MIIKLVTAFAGLDQKLLLSCQPVELVKKGLSAIQKKLFIDNMDDYVLRIAKKCGTKVDYSKPALDPSQTWMKQGVNPSTIVYVLQKTAELTPEQIAVLPQDEEDEPAAGVAASEDDEKSASGSATVPAKPSPAVNDDDDPANDGGAAAAASDSGVNKSPPRTVPPPPPPKVRTPTPPAPAADESNQQSSSVRSTTPAGVPPAPAAANRPPVGAPAAKAQSVVAAAAPAAYQQQQQQQQQEYYQGGGASPAPPGALFVSPSSPPQMGPITVINVANPGLAASAADATSTESMIYQLREQNTLLSHHMSALESRNRELEAKAINAAYSHESSPAVVAQMLLKLRDAAAEIERLRASEAFLRAQLEKVQGSQSSAVASVLDKLDPQTRSLMLEDKEELDQMVEQRRKTLASTLSLYQLAHDDTEQAKIRAAQEKKRRESILTTSAFSRPQHMLTHHGGSSQVDVAQQLLFQARR